MSERVSDGAPKVRQGEVMSRVGETFTLGELRESACHRFEGHTRRMVAGMLARGAVEPAQLVLALAAEQWRALGRPDRAAAATNVIPAT